MDINEAVFDIFQVSMMCVVTRFRRARREYVKRRGRDVERGKIPNRRTIIKTPSQEGFTDGMSGEYWKNAMCSYVGRLVRA